MLTQERLKELLHYDDATGLFTWRVVNNNRVRVGAVAGSVTGYGYIQIQIDGHRYQSHRLAWLYVHGEIPPDQIDHIDHCKNNNRIENLRLATGCQNQMNRRVSVKNTSGYKGVHFDKNTCKWMASARANGGRRHYLGLFDTAEQASEAYQAFARQHHGEFYLPQKVNR